MDRKKPVSLSSTEDLEDLPRGLICSNLIFFVELQQPRAREDARAREMSPRRLTGLQKQVSRSTRDPADASERVERRGARQGRTRERREAPLLDQVVLRPRNRATHTLTSRNAALNSRCCPSTGTSYERLERRIPSLGRRSCSTLGSRWRSIGT